MVNIAVVIGKLTKSPETRRLASGLSLANFDVRVQRADESAESVPATLFTGEGAVPEWQEGEELLVVGRVRRRFFRVGGSTQSRTEVVADRVVPVAQAGAAIEALELARGVIASVAMAGGEAIGL
jgi:single-strand DNA-binding protein